MRAAGKTAIIFLPADFYADVCEKVRQRRKLMKNRTDLRKRCLIVFLSALLVITMVPVSAFYGIGGTAEATDDQTIVHIVWQPEQPSVSTGTGGTISLQAGLNLDQTAAGEQQVASARICIALTAQEAAALTDFQTGDAAGDDATSAGQTNSGLQLVPSGDGYSLQFVLNEDSPGLEKTCRSAYHHRPRRLSAWMSVKQIYR